MVAVRTLAAAAAAALVHVASGFSALPLPPALRRGDGGSSNLAASRASPSHVKGAARLSCRDSAAGAGAGGASPLPPGAPPGDPPGAPSRRDVVRLLPAVVAAGMTGSVLAASSGRWCWSGSCTRARTRLPACMRARGSP